MSTPHNNTTLSRARYDTIETIWYNTTEYNTMTFVCLPQTANDTEIRYTLRKKYKLQTGSLHVSE